MRVVFLYNDAAEDPAHESEEADPTDSPIVHALRRLGHCVTPIACTLDLSAVRRQLEKAKPEVVFNRVESLGGSDAMMPVAAMLLEMMGLPFTGCPAEPQLATANKVRTKERLAAANLPTPAWVTLDCGLRITDCGLNSFGSKLEIGHRKFILKPVLEHASFQMDDESVVGPASIAMIRERIREREVEWGRPYFAEEYIEGREFNLALLGDEPLLLPPAEIDFSTFPSGKPRIVCHRAKCDAASFEYNNTPRRFDFPPADRPRLERLQSLARDCWRLFGLRGYARVDFRCDAAGEPWILEINTNPCLSPDAGFAAALEAAGIAYEEGIQRILDDALARRFRKQPSDLRSEICALTRYDDYRRRSEQEVTEEAERE